MRPHRSTAPATIRPLDRVSISSRGLSFAIDRQSRQVLGFVLSLDDQLCLFCVSTANRHNDRRRATSVGQRAQSSRSTPSWPSVKRMPIMSGPFPRSEAYLDKRRWSERGFGHVIMQTRPRGRRPPSTSMSQPGHHLLRRTTRSHHA